jgi:hypothetical protein
MHAIKTLPSDYHSHKILDLSNSRTMFWLNLAALPLLFLFGWIFARIFILISNTNPFPNGFWGLVTSYSLVDWIALPISIALMLVFHELVHGMFFWLFTQERPKFALKSGYAFAAAPEWYLPRLQYVLVGLSPLLVISILTVILAAFFPAHLISYLLFVATFNAAGALGDMIVVTWVLRQPDSTFIMDHGDKFLSFTQNIG